MLKLSTFCSGIGSPEEALKELGVEHEIIFSCEKDKYARQTYLANHTTNQMYEDMTTMDMSNLYSDICVAGIPCQAFSLAGKRLGELDPRGLLFYNLYDYIAKNKPKAFVIENVKGLLSDAKGKTFENWIALLSKSVNRQSNLMNHPDSLMYNLHWTVLNTKDFGLPQNRERVFVVGIRNDLPNNFKFPVGFKLTKRLKDILEESVDEKYYLSDKMVKGFIAHTERQIEKGNGFRFEPTDGNTVASSYTTRNGSRPDDNFIKVEKVGFINQDTQASAVFSADAISPTISSGTHGYAQGYIVTEATQKGFDVAQEGDSINLSNTLDTSCNQAVVVQPKLIMLGTLDDGFEQNSRVYSELGLAPTLRAKSNEVNMFTGLRIRRLTHLECFRLQGFRDDFVKPCSDSQTYKQAGNTISVPVIKGVLENLSYLWI